MTNLELVKNYQRAEALNSLMVYWYWVRLWFANNKGGTVENFIDETLAWETKEDKDREKITSFAEQEQKAERGSFVKGYGANFGSKTAVYKSKPKFTQANYKRDRVRVRTPLGVEEERYRDEIGVDDVVLAYLIWDSLTDSHVENPATSTPEFNFGGGGDFGGAGAGGEWTDNTVNNDVDNGVGVGSTVNLSSNDQIYS